MSALIKAGSGDQAARGLMGLNLRDVRRDAEGILSQARTEAAQIIAESRAAAEREREAIHERARAEGYKIGLDAGRKEGRETGLNESRAAFEKNQGQLTATLKQLIDEFGDQRDSLYAQSRRDVVLLAVVIASRFLKLLANDDAAAGQIAVEATEESLELLRGATDVRIRVHPADAAALELFVENVGEQVSGSRHLQMIDDESVGRGGVMVESAATTIDGTMDARLEKVAGELLEHWRERLTELQIKR